MKKLISMLLAVVMVVALVPSAFAADADSADPSKFTDVPADAWYWDELDYALYNGYISGTSATTFSPDAKVTRAQFVTMLSRVRNDAPAFEYNTTAFEDVDMSSWYGPAVEWARDKGIVNGVSSTRFAPSDNITVEQLGVMLYNYVDLFPIVPLSVPTTYADASSISSWAADGMAWMAKYDFLPTDVNGNVNPQQQASRAYCMVALVRMARLFHLGIEPAPMREAEGTTAEAEAQKVHDALWASGELRAGMTEKEKAIVYFKWMCMNTRYDVVSGFHKITTGDRKALSHAALTVFITGTGVCDGLAKAYLCLLETEGISCRMGIKMPENGSDGHAWAIALLDGVEYDPIDLTYYSADPDGSFSQHMFELLVEKFFYPDEYQKEFEGGFGDPLTDEELQQMLEDMQNEYNESFWQQ